MADLIITTIPGAMHVAQDGGLVSGTVQVTDNGSGMPADVLEHIFDAFFSTKGDEGTGLGLDICRQIIDQGHAGQIWAESEIGVGTAFTIRLPLAAEPTSAPCEAAKGQS